MAKKSNKKTKAAKATPAPAKRKLLPSAKSVALVVFGAVLGATLGGLVLHKYEMRYMRDRMVEQSEGCH